MSDTEIRMMCYTIEQLSAELQATRQYVSDIKTKLERTRKALDVAVDALKRLNNDSIFGMRVLGIADQAITAINEITAQEQKDK